MRGEIVRVCEGAFPWSASILLVLLLLPLWLLLLANEEVSAASFLKLVLFVLGMVMPLPLLPYLILVQ